MIVEVHNTAFEVSVIIKKNNRNSYLRVKNKCIIISTPRMFSLEKIKAFIETNYDAIMKIMSKQEPIKSDTLHLFGKTYNALVYEAGSNRITVLDEDIMIESKSLNTDYLKALVNSFYIDKLKKYVEERIITIKKEFHIDFDIILDYKNVKTYFGECFFKRKRVHFSSRLAKYDPKYIDSVIYHELAHFYYQDHQKDFYELLEKLYPGYKKIQRELKQIKYHDIYE